MLGVKVVPERMDARFREVRTAQFSVIAAARPAISRHNISTFTKRQQRVTRDVELVSLPGYEIGICVLGLDAGHATTWTQDTWDWILQIFSEYTLVVFCSEPITSFNDILAVEESSVDTFARLKSILRQRADYDSLSRSSGIEELGCTELSWISWAYGNTSFCKLESILHAAAYLVQAEVSAGRGTAAVQSVVSAMVESGAHLIKFGNLRFQIAQNFGFVMPTEPLLTWMHRLFKAKGCKRVLSIGSGCGFLEMALQLSIQSAGDNIDVVCLETENEGLGLAFSQNGRGFHTQGMQHWKALPEGEEMLRDTDGIMICYGRPAMDPFDPDTGVEDEDHIWRHVEQLVHSAGVESPPVVIIVGESGDGCDTFRVDRWCGSELGSEGNKNSIWQGTRSCDKGIYEEEVRTGLEAGDGTNAACVLRFPHHSKDEAVAWSRIDHKR